MRAIRSLFFLCVVSSSFGQTKKDVNYDEAKASKFAIPDPLVCVDGTRITTAEEWLTKRRPELLQLFAQEEYGRTPDMKPSALRFVVASEDKHALGGKATMRQINIFFTVKDEPHTTVLLYLPNGHQNPAPVIVGLNFGGNQTVTHDPAVKLSDGWFRNDAKRGYVDNKATDQTRGSSTEQWPIEQIINRGYGVATAYYGDFEPDQPEGLSAGIRPLFFKPGQTAPAEDEWGAIGAWAWGLSRIADYLVTLPEVNSKKLMLLGHSRLGKSALWAGAQDERFSIVISNESGAGGAALHKRIFGETAGSINLAFPHWFCGNFKKYSENEGALPMDQHELIALMAPRPVYIASATQDTWADPKGEFLSGKLAEPVYALFGKKGLGVDEPPLADKSVGDSIGYHVRTGKHDILQFDWEQYMSFADRHWGRPE